MSAALSNLTTSPTTSLRHFPTHERAQSEPPPSPEPSSPSSPSQNYPRISFSGPEKARTRSTSLSRPPTPHRGYSLAVPEPAGPSSQPQVVETSEGYDSGSGDGSRRRRNLSSSSRVVSVRGAEEDEALEMAETGRRGFRDARSKDTIRTSRTGGTRSRERRLASSPCPTAASASPLDFHDVVQIYAIVAARRGNFDILLWSVPSTSFAAQAFLFQTALAGDSSRTSRIVSMSLSLLITVLTLQLFTSQLGHEAADHAWLNDWEKRHRVDPADCAHGETWQKYRAVLPPRARYFKVLASIRGFTLWSNGMLIIGLVALGVLIAASVKGDAFQNCQNN